MSQQVVRVLDLQQIEKGIGEILVDCCGLDSDEPTPDKRLIEDLGADSIDLMDIFFRIEKEFEVRVPRFEESDVLLKTVFSRGPLRVADLAEIVYLILSNDDLQAAKVGGASQRLHNAPSPQFTQISGRAWWTSAEAKVDFDELGENRYRRTVDGMICIDVPAQTATIGSDSSLAEADERPSHQVHVDTFRIDTELVSTTAYCRFLNSVEPDDGTLATWVLLPGQNHNGRFTPLECRDGTWSVRPSAEQWPMFNVSWFGAAAYSRWVNGQPALTENTEESFLPSELQWEVAARRGYEHRDADGNQTFIAGLHRAETTYEIADFPFGGVHESRGISEYGLKHAAGNVWEWCRDWYAEDFYLRPEATEPNCENACPTGIRSERGGSWVGPVELCRTTYRRGRVPTAFGRCLGFRCVSVRTK